MSEEIKEPVAETEAPPVKPKAKRKPAAKRPEPESPWHIMELQSDKDLTVEACEMFSFEKRGSLLRYRVNGKLIPQIDFVPLFVPKIKDGIWQLR